MTLDRNAVNRRTCESIYCSDVALLSSTSCCYSDGVLSPRVQVCQRGGGDIFRYRQLEGKVTLTKPKRALYSAVVQQTNLLRAVMTSFVLIQFSGSLYNLEKTCPAKSGAHYSVVQCNYKYTCTCSYIVFKL